MPPPMSTDSHQSLLALLQPIEGELEGYARRMVWRNEDLPDVLQNAVLSAYAAFDRYREDASFRTWTFKIFTNEIYRRSLSHGRRCLARWHSRGSHTRQTEHQPCGPSRGLPHQGGSMLSRAVSQLRIGGCGHLAFTSRSGFRSTRSNRRSHRRRCRRSCWHTRRRS